MSALLLLRLRCLMMDDFAFAESLARCLRGESCLAVRSVLVLPPTRLTLRFVPKSTAAIMELASMTEYVA